ncbi:MAG: geranylgeranyl diphosphate synthetase [Candidatus Micrarchaeota archaeon]|nr:MAG: geranylgeranyl diphosphate synthetase [Candidatus Micrarchaeota archaeon]
MGIKELRDNLPKEFSKFAELIKEDVYNKIKEYTSLSNVKEHYRKMLNEYVDRKGQYRRPSYLILWTMLYNGNAEDALLPAAAQQLSEDWLLMIDDWMDNNLLRRGGKAAYLIYGDKLTINAASDLQALNWKIAIDAYKQLGEPRGSRYIRKFFDMLHVTHIGQYLDLTLTSSKDITSFTIEDYYESIHAKSAYYSVYGPMQQGAIIANADESKVEAIESYGVPAGRAFQIIDDVLDCASDDKTLGKTVGTDVRDGVKTIILWHAVHNASQQQLDMLKEIYAKNPEMKTDEEIHKVIELFKELGSIDFAKNEAKRLIDEALSNFNKVERDLAENQIKDLARDSLTYIVNRIK